MGQIQRTIDIVTDPNADLESALLQCKVLARRLKYKALQDWVDWELNGYDSLDNLPAYRRFKSVPRGLYTNGVWRVENQSVSPDVVGDELFEKMQDLPIFAGISTVISQRGETKLAMSLARDEARINGLYSLMVEGGYGFIGLHIPIPPGTFDSIISSVRDHLLSFLLDMEEIFPEEQDILTPSPQQKRDVEQAFIHNIYNYGSIQNLAIGDQARVEDNSLALEMNIAEGSVEDLTNYLLNQGLNREDIEEIDPLLGYVYQGNLSNSQKSQLRKWVEDKGSKLAGSLGKEAAVSMIVQALMQYAPTATGFL